MRGECELGCAEAAIGLINPAPLRLRHSVAGVLSHDCELRFVFVPSP